MHYYQFNISDYRKDTVHLSPIEHYIYRQLIDWYYLDETPIPRKTQVVLRRLGLGSQSDTLGLENVLNDFFEDTKEGWKHKRIEEELVNYRAKGDTARENGRKGGRPKKQGKQQDKNSEKPRKTQPVFLANPEESKQNPTVTQQKANYKPITNNQDIKEPKGSCRAGPTNTAKEILEFLNTKTGRNYQPVDANLKLIKARLKEYSPGQLRQVVAKKAREWNNDDKMAEYLRPATLFNATKCAQYVGELVVVEVDA